MTPKELQLQVSVSQLKHKQTNTHTQWILKTKLDEPASQNGTEGLPETAGHHTIRPYKAEDKTY